METNFVNNTTINGAKKRFELHIGEKMAILEYFTARGNISYLVHTEVESSLQGKGYASVLVKDALDYLRDEHTQIVPVCPFVRAFLKRRPEYQGMVVPDFRYMIAEGASA